MCDLFETRNLDYNLRSRYYGIKSVENLNLFKKKIRNWEPKGCHYKLCKQYLHGVGYVDTFDIYCF